MIWEKELAVRDINEAQLKSLTDVAAMTATIPTIWSSKLEKNYQRIVKMPQFAVQNTELLGRSGDKVKISKMSDIGPAEDLEKTGPAGQSARGAETTWNNTTTGIETAFASRLLVELEPTMKFKAVKFTRKEMLLSFAGRMSDATEGLAYAFQLKMDMDCFEALSTAAPGIIGPADWTTLVAGDVFSTDIIRQAKLRYNLQVELNEWAYFAGGTCVCLISPYQKYHLTQDVDWFDVVKRNSAEAIFKGELVEWDGVRFVESTGVPYYAGGTLTEITTAQDMVPFDGTTTPNREWLFSTDGSYANRTGFIAPRYQTDITGDQGILIDPDTSDADAKITLLDYHNGIVKFDVEVGGTVEPTAVFSYGSVHGYSSPIIGPRAFSIAWKERPRLATEMTNYQLFIGVGGTSSYDVKMLNPEQVVLANTAVVPPFSLAP